MKILLGLIVVIIIAVSAVFYFTADMVTSAESFFAAVQQGEIDEAYDDLSEDFKSSTSKADLQQFLDGHGLNRFKEASWGSRSVKSGRGTLVGSITTDSGGVVPITVSLVKEQGSWKIYSIHKPGSGLQQDSADLVMPSEQTQIDMVNESMGRFATAVNEKSMSTFYPYISNLWQKETSVEQLDTNFKVFLDAGIDFTVLEGFSPSFDSAPEINKDGVLEIKGHYPTSPSKVFFEYRYIHEGSSWKLVGLSTDVKAE